MLVGYLVSSCDITKFIRQKFKPFGILATCSESHATNNSMQKAPKILLLLSIHFGWISCDILWYHQVFFFSDIFNLRAPRNMNLISVPICSTKFWISLKVPLIYITSGALVNCHLIWHIICFDGPWFWLGNGTPDHRLAFIFQIHKVEATLQRFERPLYCVKICLDKNPWVDNHETLCLSNLYYLFYFFNSFTFHGLISQHTLSFQKEHYKAH